jgi:hypothetical protein
MPNSVRLHDIAAVIWTCACLLGDGSYGYQGAAEGFMGAGVVWRDRDNNGYYQPYKLGRRTGNSEDAEVFAIAAALGQAQNEMKRGRNIRLVRIISDAKSALEGLQHGTQCRFGPMLSTQRRRRASTSARLVDELRHPSQAGVGEGPLEQRRQPYGRSSRQPSRQRPNI